MMIKDVLPFLSPVVLIAMCAFTAVMYSRLPLRMAVHWNLKGEDDGHMPRFWGAVLVPIIGILLYPFLKFVPLLDSDHPVLSGTAAWEALLLSVVLFMAFLQVLLIAFNLRRKNKDTAMRPSAFLRNLVCASGLLFAVIGILLPRFKLNAIAGIRTPWSMVNERVWAQVHLVGGYTFVACGFLTFFAAILVPKRSLIILLVVCGVGVVFTIYYSYHIGSRVVG